MKRLLALTMAGVMLLAEPVMAAEVKEEVVENTGGVVDTGETADTDDAGKSNVGGSISPTPSTVKPKPKKKPKHEAPQPPAPVVEAPSVPTSVTQAAAAEGKTVGEYMNNAVTAVPGLENAVPIAQGGHVIINGAPSNQVFSVLKPAQAYVSSAKSYASALGGSVLNVVRVNASVNGFQTARVNFYMKGVRTGQIIKVFQIINGQWVELGVAEIREDHVVVDMTSLGTLAFIAMPNQ